MEEVIKNTKYSEEIINRESYDQNELFLTIIKLQRYDLLGTNNIQITISDDDMSLAIIKQLLSDEDTLYYIKDEYTFEEATKNKIAQLVLKNYTNNSRLFSNFLYNFFDSKEERNNFIKNNRQRFIEYLNKEENNLAYPIIDIDEFINIILSERKIKLIKNIENYSLRNLKLLSELLEKENPLPYYCGSDRAIKNIFNNIDNLTNKELNNLLKLFTYKPEYMRKTRDKTDEFTNYLQENIDRLFECVTDANYIPKCLVENPYFRDECIKRNRIDLAVQCILPKEIINDEQLAEMYCEELQIDKKDLYTRVKWLTEYSKRNNNIFNTFIGYMLKDEFYTLPTHHFERFINDVDIQMSLGSLEKKELEVLSIILNQFDYKEYEVTHMIANIIRNISNYKELIDNLDIPNLTEKKLSSLICLLQHEENIYHITTEIDLETLKEIKQKRYIEERKLSDLNKSKNNLCQSILNISLEEASRINELYCYQRKTKIIERLRGSELQSPTFNILSVINAIVETENIELLDQYFQEYLEHSLYDSKIPVEIYLRSQYAKLYSDTLYKVETPVQEIDGLPSKIVQTIEYNDKKLDVCIPRDNFAFLVHCVGTCSNMGDETDENYQRDWEFRPQIQDHFIACSYINHQLLYSLRAGNLITYGFSNIESGSLYGMGSTDIDSIGQYSTAYASSQELMDQGGRACFIIPSLMIEATEGYNEFVIERRNLSDNNECFKRKPDYIIMSVDSIENSANFTTLSQLFSIELSDLTEEEQEQIRMSSSQTEIRRILNARSSRKQAENMTSEKTTSDYIELISSAKYYEQCLKAASEFNIPLVIIDRQYYFNRALEESLAYDEQTKKEIEKLYQTSDEYNKKDIFNAVSKNKSYESIKSKNSNKNQQPFTISL